MRAIGALRRTRWLALLTLIALTYGCASDRWQIHKAELMYAGVQEGRDRHTLSTILLDVETGDTWIWWPTRDNQHGYSWLPVPKETEPGERRPYPPEF